MTEQAPKASDTNHPECPRRSLFRIVFAKVYKFLVDLGPIATLIAILLTNYHNCRSYQFSKEGTRAWLHVRDVTLVFGEANKIQMFFANAGSRPAHVLRHAGRIFLPRPDDLSFHIGEYEGPTTQVDAMIDKGSSLGFAVPFPSLANLGDNYKPVESFQQLLDLLRHYKQSIYLHGKLQYFDGVETYWIPYCKVLTADAGWQTCPDTVSP